MEVPDGAVGSFLVVGKGGVYGRDRAAGAIESNGNTAKRAKIAKAVGAAQGVLESLAILAVASLRDAVAPPKLTGRRHAPLDSSQALPIPVVQIRIRRTSRPAEVER
jgi:hypothetical protein